MLNKDLAQLINNHYTESMINNEDQSMPSNELAKKIIQIITEKNDSPSYSITQLLNFLKHKKNPNHQKFSIYIEKQLQAAKLDIFKMVDMIKFLGSKMKSVSNSESQVRSIVHGFRKFLFTYFKQSIPPKIKKDFTLSLIKNYFEFDDSFSSLISELISLNTNKLSQANRQFCQKELCNSIVEVVKFNQLSEQNSKQCCNLIHHMDLYRFFRTQDLVCIAKHINLQQAQVFLRDRNRHIIDDLARAFITKQIFRDEDKAIKLIKKMDMKPIQFPQLVKNLTKKSLRYFMSQQPIYALDLKIKGRPDVAECLVQILIDQNREKQALHFINKFYLTKFYDINPSSNRSYNKNILQKYDTFAPTEHILADTLPNSKYSKKFLTLDELGFKQQDVIFVNSNNITQKILQNVINSPMFSMDCESAPVFHAYENDNRTTETIQIALKYTIFDMEINQDINVKFVYIFDFQDLKTNKLFKQWLERLCCHYKGKIIGHSVSRDFYTLVAESNLRNLSKEIQHLKFVDVAELFKQKYDQRKSSLEFICDFIFKKSLSKFEQCSGWHNRPLRKSQLHYGALDAVLPLLIFKKLKQ